MSVQAIRTKLFTAALSFAVPALVTFTPAVRGDEKPASNPPSQAAAKSAAIPAGVVGSWKYGSISPLWVKDLNTGMLSTSQSMGSFYEFAADGSFKHFVLISFNSSGWKNGTFTEEYGTAQFDAQKNTVTLTLTSGKYRVMDNRVQKNNYTRDMTAEEIKKHSSTISYKLSKGEDGKPRLELGHASNDGTTTYSRWEDAARGGGK